MTDISEKNVIRDLLALYKDSPCLWNTSSSEYGNKDAKNEAYSRLVERLRLFDQNAGLATLRKRLDNLRASYRREHKKVLQNKQHTPSLWYYPYLTFLNETMTFPNIQDDDDNDSGAGESSGSQLSKSFYRDSVTGIKDEDSGEECYMAEYLENDAEQDITVEDSYIIKPTTENYVIKPQATEEYVIKPREDVSEASAFGRALGFQLSELTPMQKTIAEKLIGDIIFYARLDKLTTKTTLINLNDDDCL